MKVAHQVRVPPTNNMTGKLDADYQAEVDASMERLSREYERELKALAIQERRRVKAENRSLNAATSAERREASARLRAIDEAIEARRQELLKLQRLMTEIPAPSRNRGSRTVRHVSKQGDGIAGLVSARPVRK